MITVDTSKLPAHLADVIWFYFDGGQGVLGGKVQIMFGTFIDILESEGVIICPT